MISLSTKNAALALASILMCSMTAGASQDGWPRLVNTMTAGSDLSQKDNLTLFVGKTENGILQTGNSASFAGKVEKATGVCSLAVRHIDNSLMLRSEIFEQIPQGVNLKEVSVSLPGGTLTLNKQRDIDSGIFKINYKSSFGGLEIRQIKHRDPFVGHAIFKTDDINPTKLREFQFFGGFDEQSKIDVANMTARVACVNLTPVLVVSGQQLLNLENQVEVFANKHNPYPSESYKLNSQKTECSALTSELAYCRFNLTSSQDESLIALVEIDRNLGTFGKVLDFAEENYN